MSNNQDSDYQTHISSGSLLSTSDRTRPSFSSLGIPKHWLPIYEWACRSDVLYEWLLLYDTALLEARPYALGTILEEFSSPTSIEVLENSCTGSTAAQILLNLANAYTRTCKRDFPKDFRAAIRGASAQSLLPKKLPQLYFLALAVDVLPTGPAQHACWLSRLRIWFYIHAIAQGQARNFQDHALRAIATDLRHASRDSDEKLNFFFKLHTSATAIDTLDRWIDYKCHLIAASTNNLRELPSTHQKLLRSLQRIAKGDPDPDDSFTPPRSAIANNFEVFRTWHAEQPEIDISEDSTSVLPDSAIHMQRRTDQDGDFDIAGVGVEGIASYTHQRLKANSVLLFNAEEMAFLPWTWDKPNPIELRGLNNWVHSNLAGLSDAERFMGSLVWISTRTGRSLKRCLDIAFATTPSNEWALDISANRLHRAPPVRISSWAPRTDDEADWVESLAECISVPLPTDVSNCLTELLQRSGTAQYLGDLWDSHWGPSADNWFIRHLPDTIKRLTPAMLQGVLPQRLYDGAEHAAFARTVSSHPRSGLPGACAYGNWSLKEVQRHLNPHPIFDSTDRPPPPPIGAGSRLDPRQSLLNDGVASMANQVAALRTEGKVVAFHNVFTTYVCMQLWAATGARPIRDPFESVLHFDLQENFVFIDDKASGNLRQGRLVPLPTSLARFISRVYPRHLRAVAATLNKANASLAAEIRGMADRKPSGAMPYFFLLTDQPAPGWESVSESSINRLGVLNCPLPLNLFRQRLPKQLHRLGCDAEIIDALLGHAEASLATHGDQSPRIWQEDMAQARPFLEQAYANMHFRWLRGWDGAAIKTCILEPVAAPHTTVLFGSEAREKNRKRTLFAAIRDARLQIVQACAGKDITELTPDELDTLSNALLFNPKGLPRPTGYFRYQLLMRQLEKAWLEKGKRVRLKKRYVRLTEESPFTDAAPGALSLYRTLCEILGNAASAFPASRVPVKNSAALAAVVLSVESRISSFQLLQDLIHGRNFRITQYQRQYYLEHAPDLVAEDSNAAVVRHAISPYGAALLDRVLGSKHSLPADSTEIPQELQSVADCMHESGCWQPHENLVSLIRTLIKLIDQVNAMTLPGILAGYLAGRISSSSLPWRSWVGLDTGRILQIGDSTEDRSDSPVPDGALPASPGLGAGIASTDAESATRAAHKFFSDIRKALTPVDENLPENSTEKKRTTISGSVKKVLQENRTTVSTAVFLLGQWTLSLIHRKKDSRNYLVLGTVQRYLAALSPAFQDIGADVDIFALNEEQITEYYCDILETRAPERPGYVTARLLDFHRWAMSQGIANPDWNEIPLTADKNVVSPGIVSEDDYVSALALLENQPNSTPREARGLAFILLLCYRFGLRAAEALGMTRNDWIESEDEIVVLVRHHVFRKLKTPLQSRRQVPLVFQLSAKEKKLIRHWMNDHKATFGDDDDAPLFSANGNRREIMPLRECSTAIRDVLKLVTGNPGTTLHQARHTTLNRVACALLRIQPSPWRNLCKTDNPDSIARTLLGSRQRTTRRIVWALRRYAGHGATNTIFRNYLHVLGDWAAELTADQINAGNFRTLKNAVDLDAFETMAKADWRVLQAMPEKVTKVPDTEQAVLLMRLVGRGVGVREAAESIGVPLSWADQLVTALTEIASQSKGKGATKDSNAQLRAFLGRVTESAWTRLRKMCHERESTGSRLQNEPAPPHAENSNLAVLLKILGERRQLVMWESAHFEFTRKALYFYGIPPGQFTVFHSQRSKQEMLDRARSFGFDPRSPKALAGRPAYQLDSVIVTGNFQIERCALVFLENDSYEIRNSIEFTLLLTAFASVHP